MEEKVIKIEIPEGYEIDKEKSTFEKIVFKLKKEDYNSVCKELFLNKLGYFCNRRGRIESTILNDFYYEDISNCTSEKQAKKLLAINQLMNIAKYLNGDWEPDWRNEDEKKYIIFIDEQCNRTVIDCKYIVNTSIVYFKTKELAQKAIEIFGEGMIRFALSTDW